MNLKKNPFNRNESKTQPGRSWLINIETAFANTEDITQSFIENWLSVINNSDISFIIYRFNLLKNKSENLTISAFVELKLSSRENKVRRIFAFDGNFLDIKRNHGSNFLSISEIINGCSNIDKELFWCGIPRNNKGISDDTSFSFVIKYNLKNKAREKPRMPDFLQKFEIK